MGVTIEPLVSAVRQGADHEQYGDDWTVSAVLMHVSPTEAVMKLARSDELALRPWFEVRDALKASGLQRIRYQRYRRGELIETEILL